jgi:3'-phosphoadenosine 5'-phosphosulfate sulfotransferase (PAPS reductase)/FAD synthetase
VGYETASRHGEPFDRMVEYYRQFRVGVKKIPAVLPNPAQRMCTEFLKIRVGENFMRSRGYDYWDGYVGIRADEPKRLAKMRQANEAGRRRWEGTAPLAEAGITKANVAAFWAAQPFRLSLKSYEGNCKMCFLKATPKLYRLQKERPQETGIERWVAREETTGQRFRNDRDAYAVINRRAVMICVNCWENDALADGRFCYRCILTPGGVQCASDDLADCFCGE